MTTNADILARQFAELCTERVLRHVRDERRRQDQKWGEQNHPDGTGPGLSFLWFPEEPIGCTVERAARCRTDREHQAGRGTYEQILTEEWAEAIATSDRAKLRAELVQVAAVAVAWVEKIDRGR